MNFEELKMAWDSQNEQPTLVINQDALYASVKRKSLLIDGQVGWMEVVNINIGFLLTPIFLIDFLVHTLLKPNGNIYQNIISLVLAFICLRLGLHGWRGRRTRKVNNSVGINQSMLGSIDQSHKQIDYYVKNAYDLIWFYLVPLAFLSVINLVFFINDNTPWVWIATLACCLFGTWETMRDIRERLIPERKNLIYLREMLLSDKQM